MRRSAWGIAGSPLLALALAAPHLGASPPIGSPLLEVLLDSEIPIAVPNTGAEPRGREEARQLARHAAAAYAKKDYDRAIAAYTEAIRLDPGRAALHNNRAAARLGKKDEAGALVDYNEAIRLDPENASAYYGRGLVWHSRKDYDRAIADFDEALRRPPKFSGAYNNRGLAWFDKHEYDKAIADFNEALRLDPDSPLIYNNRGNCREAQGDLDRALRDYSEAIRLDPQYVKARGNRARLFASEGKATEALEDLGEVIRLDPKGSRAYRARAWILATSPDASVRNGKEAISDASKAFELTGRDDPIILETLAAAHAEVGQFQEAVSMQGKALGLLSPADARRPAFESRLALYREGHAYHEPEPTALVSKSRRLRKSSWHR
ncbi:tetratricopeptide repeat protein [Singulisphaera sp. PoT]|uniref:tetratricopeptide repeat protein n=1 Tax=Singulisphaera sp. PoT TaxID=3411797 RepID=UPI003BF4E1A7